MLQMSVRSGLRIIYTDCSLAVFSFNTLLLLRSFYPLVNPFSGLRVSGFSGLRAFGFTLKRAKSFAGLRVSGLAGLPAKGFAGLQFCS
jgi:hypothetical protein